MESIWMGVMPFLLAAVMFAGAYFTYNGKFTLFVTYLNSRVDQSEKEKIEAQRKKYAVRQCLIMGIIVLLAGVAHFVLQPLFEYLLMAIYLFLLISFLGRALGAQNNKVIFTIVAGLLAFLFFANSFTLLYGVNSASIQDGMIQITGSNAVAIDIKDVQQITWYDTAPEKGEAVGIAKEFNGSFRGTYQVNGQQAQVYYNGGTACVYIETSKDRYYIALSDDDTTKTFYEELKKDSTLSSLCE